MPKTRLICVGACAIDTILTVPHLPEEDSKLRATAFSRRRGGNTSNSLEVLQQLLEDDERHLDRGGIASEASQAVELFLVATLPAKQAADTALIESSFSLAQGQVCAENDDIGTVSKTSPKGSRIDLSQCIYREDHSEAISSYIISSQATSSRTIINHNALPEMTFPEFADSLQSLARTSPNQNVWMADRFWFHFEGRIPPTTQDCIQYIRNHPAFDDSKNGRSNASELTISVELEKPGREGLQELMYLADVVFYSKAWAKGLGYESAEVCLCEQATKQLHSPSATTSRKKLLICPWGERGACALQVPGKSPSRNPPENALLLRNHIVHSPAYDCSGRDIIDSTGAGDTFIAGMLYGLICRDQADLSQQPSWSLKDKLDFANGLAGRKILQDGFGGLGESTRHLRGSLDNPSG